MTSTTVATIASQARALGITGETLVEVDENTLRIVHARVDRKSVAPRKHFANVDIRYDAGNDLYDVAIHTIHNDTFTIATREIEGIYADQLADLLTD